MNENEKLDNIRLRFNQNSDVSAVVIVNNLNQVSGLITRQDLLSDRLVEVTMICCQKPENSIDGLKAAGVFVERVIDITHYAGFNSTLPVDFTIKPYGSVCTCIAEMYK